MPRQARIDAPGAVHHIIIRGMERRPIFRDDLDRTRFLERFAQGVVDSQTACFAWALMPNHAHFLLRTGSRPIAELMRRLLIEELGTSLLYAFWSEGVVRAHRIQPGNERCSMSEVWR